jgi:peptide deformylase
VSERLIVKLGDPILRKGCKPITEITSNVIKLLDDMADTLYGGPNRAGLAAPQVGVLKRLVVIDCGDGLIELINPEIIKMSGEQIGQEACLSMPGLLGKVKRTKYVSVKTLNRSGEEIILEAKGPLARCFQHEIDHLNGVLFIDHVRPGDLYNETSGKPVDVFEVIGYSRQNS